MTAPTTGMNLRRVLRAMQLSKPILLEGSPGVGKTSLISALAALSGNRLVRINLSEQTDIADLMGSDLPMPKTTVSTGEPNSESQPTATSGTQFKWCDGLFLRALKRGDWILLDELNLASQSVLEGLNSCLDHRAQVFIPELGKTYSCPPSFRIFAAQNPMVQGGGRKGLPKSFLNRFVKVHVEALDRQDLGSILGRVFPQVNANLRDKMIDFNSAVQEEVTDKRSFGQNGSPWEFNLRDVFRWCELIKKNEQKLSDSFDSDDVVRFVDTLYFQRFRTEEDREFLAQLFHHCFGRKYRVACPLFHMTDDIVQVGNVSLKRNGVQTPLGTLKNAPFRGPDPTLLRSIHRPMEAVAHCIDMNWPCLLVGASSTGKSTLLKILSESCNTCMEEIAMTPSSDVSELIGCFEQTDSRESSERSLMELMNGLHEMACQILISEDAQLEILRQICDLYWNLERKNEDRDEASFERASYEEALHPIANSLLACFDKGTRLNAEFSHHAGDSILSARIVLTELMSYGKKSSQEGGVDFCWVDGVLVRAMEAGHWVHLENVNFCPASVLDRLNPLMETGRELVLTECGIVDGDKPRIVKAHPNFRLFLSMNPGSGEVSRAMRNRCVEISLLGKTSTGGKYSRIPDKLMLDVADKESAERLVVQAAHQESLDAMDTIWKTGIRSASTAMKVLEMHRLECTRSERFMEDAPTMRQLKDLGDIICDLGRQGWSTNMSVEICYQIVYGLTESDAKSAATQANKNAVFGFDGLIGGMELREQWYSNPLRAQVSRDARLPSIIAEWNKFQKMSLLSSQTTPLGMQLIDADIGCRDDMSTRYHKFRLNPSEISKSISNLEIIALSQFVKNVSILDGSTRACYFVENVPHLADNVKFMMHLLRSSLARLGVSFECAGIPESLQYLLSHPVSIFGTDLPSTGEFDPVAMKKMRQSLDYIQVSCVNRYPHLLTEQLMYAKLSQTDPSCLQINKMGTIQISFCIRNSKIDRSIISCTVTPYLFPFFEALDDSIHEWERNFTRAGLFPSPEGVKAFAKFLSCRDGLWQCLQSSTYSVKSSYFIGFDEAGFLVQWRWMKKALDVFNNICINFSFGDNQNDDPKLETSSKQRFDQLIKKIDEILYGASMGTMTDMMWKKGHPLVPTTASQWESLQKLRDCARSCSFISEDRFGLVARMAGMCKHMGLEELIKMNHPSLFLETYLKEEILAALCMTQWACTDEVRAIRSMDDVYDVEKAPIVIGKHIDDISSKFASEVKSAMIDTEIRTVENEYGIEELEKMRPTIKNGNSPNGDIIHSLLEKWGLIQTSQLAEIWATSEENNIICEISKMIFTKTVQEIRSLAPRLKRFIKIAISQTQWLSSLRPYQTLLWACEADSITSDDLIHLLKSIFPLMAFFSLQHSWCNTFNDLDCLSNKLTSPRFWKNEKDGMDEENEDEHIEAANSSALDICPHRTKQTVLSAALLRLSGPPSDSSSHQKFPLLTLENYESRRKQAETIMGQLAVFKMEERNDLTIFFLKHIFSEVVEALGDDFSGDDDTSNLLLMMNGKKGTETLEQIVANCKNVSFKNIAHEILSPLVVLFQSLDTQEDKAKREETIALLFVYVGLLRLHLTLPSSPLDPARKPAAKVSQWNKKTYGLKSKLTVLQWESRVNTGENCPNTPESVALVEDAEIASVKCEIQTRKIVERSTNAPPFIHMYREVHRFADTIGNINGVLDLVTLITSSDLKNFKLGYAKELNWQSSACAFSNRLSQHYSFYEDVTVPCINSVRVIQQGLRGLVGVRKQEHITSSAVLGTLFDKFLHFPHGNFHDAFQIGDLVSQNDIESTLGENHDLSSDSNAPSNTLTSSASESSACHLSLTFAALARMELQTRLHGGKVSSTSNELILQSFGAVVEAWDNFKKLSESETKASNSSNSASTDEEKLKEKFYEQFPDHRKEFQEIINSTEDPSGEYGHDETVDVEKSTEPSFSLSREQVSQLCYFHEVLFKEDFRPVDDSCRIRTFKFGYDATRGLGQNKNWANGAKPQQYRTGAHMMGLSVGINISHRGNLCSSLPLKHQNAIDFHNDANPLEVVKAEPVLRGLLSRVGQLLEAFPGHSVLLSLGQVADRMRQLNLPVVPLAKVLTGLEVILRKSQEWEQHASERVALGIALHDVSKLVTQWRKLELSSWSSMLDVREKRYIQRAQNHWMRMYLLLNSAQSKLPDKVKQPSSITSSACSPSWVWKGLQSVVGKKYMSTFDVYISEQMSNLTKLVDGFLLTSGLGEFQERLRMVGAFASQIQRSCESMTDAYKCALSRTLSSLYRHYSQFVPIVLESCLKSRGPIEKRLKDEVKLAKWDEQNYYALAESTEKNHHKLGRYLREYDEVLDKSISTVLEENFLYGVRSSSEMSISGTEPANSVPHPSTIFPQLEAQSSKKIIAKRNQGFITIKESIPNLQLNFPDKYVWNMEKYHKKMCKMIQSKVTRFDSWAKSGSSGADDLCSAIFDRIEILRGEKITKPMKQRALVDLFKYLKKQGYSTSRYVVPSEIRDMHYILHLPIPNANSKYHGESVEIAEKYFYRCTVEISRLRSEIAMFGSQHMSQREMLMMMAFSDHGLTMLCQQRCLLVALMKDITDTESYLESFESVNEGIPEGQTTLTNHIVQFDGQFMSSLESLKQLLVLMKNSNILIKNEKKTSYVRDIISVIEDCVHSLNFAYTPPKPGTGICLISNERVESILKTKDNLMEVISKLQSCRDKCDITQCLPKEIFESTIDQVDTAYHTALGLFNPLVNDKTCSKNTTVEDVLKSNSTLVQTSMLVVQNLCKNERHTEEDAGENNEDSSDCSSTTPATLWESHTNSTNEWVSFINIKRLKDNLQDLASKLIECTGLAKDSLPVKDLELCLTASCNSCKFAATIEEHILKPRLEDFTEFYRNSAKLTYVLLRIFRVLVAKGFCTDESEEDDNAEGDVSNMKFDDDIDGTGMGEGEGKSDVTDQIENEEQLLGLKGDEPPDDEKKKDPNQLDKEEADKGMEMEADFEGEMHDMPDENDANEDDNNDEEEELDREMGDESSPDENVIDEKMWDGDDEDDTNNQEEEKFEENSKLQGEAIEDEIRTKEENEEEKGESEGKDGQKEDETKDEPDQMNTDREDDLAGADESNENNENNDEINEDTEDKYEENHTGIDVRNEDEDDEPADDGMDLNDDMNLDADEDGEEDHNDDSPHDEDVGDAEDGDDHKPEEVTNETDNDEDEDENDIEDETLPASSQVVGEADQKEDPEDNGNEDVDENNHVDIESNTQHQESDDAHGIAAENGKDKSNGNEEMKEDKEEKDVDVDGNGDNEMTEDGAGKDDKSNEENLDQGKEDNNGSGDWQKGKEDNNTGDDNDQHNEEAPNPFCDIGDAQKFWHKKLSLIQDENGEGEEPCNDEDHQEEDDENDGNNETTSEGMFEFTNNGESSTTQVLGRSIEENALLQLDKKENETEKTGDQMEVDEEPQKPDISKEGEQKSKENNRKNKNEEKNSTEKEQRDSTADPSSKVDSTVESNSDESVTENEAIDVDEEVDCNEDDVNTLPDDMDSESEPTNEVITDLSQLRVQEKTESNNGQRIEIQTVTNSITDAVSSLDQCRTQWSTIQSETSTLSRRLCEKLRLVLEPLTATKLRGDYRTGKRINMKRIIGFIASGYRKDKIWLRRTKPAKRDYRVLLCVDNSESMLKSRAGDMALMAMATLAVGMGQLEVGDLGVASFGEEMRLLHPFEKPFTSESGVDVVGNFKFDQKRTKMSLCLESALAALGNEKAGSLQLVFIISDGRIERDNRSDLRRLVREMTEMNILLVAIIVEGDDGIKNKEKNSIVNMKEVSFDENGKPNVKNFIEDYPFPYYIILKDMKSLPEILGDALRQWFEMLSQLQVHGMA